MKKIAVFFLLLLISMIQSEQRTSLEINRLITLIIPCFLMKRKKENYLD